VTSGEQDFTCASFPSYMLSPPQSPNTKNLDLLDENDLLAVCKIIEAAIWWTAAEKIEVLPPSSSPSPSTTFSGDVVNGAGNGDELEAEEDERKVSKCCAGCQA
jgi:hypothetical protein